VPIEETALAREVVRTATKAENPFQNHPPTTQFESFEDHRPNERTRFETVVQKKAVNCAEPQSEHNSMSIKQPISIKEMVNKVTKEPVALSTRESLSTWPEVCRPVEKLATTRRAFEPDQAATAVFVEGKREEGDAEIFMAKVVHEPDRAIVASDFH